MQALTLLVTNLTAYAPLYMAFGVGFVFALSYVLRKYDSGKIKKGR